MGFLSKVLNYERSVFEKYCTARAKLIDQITTLNFKKLDKKQKIVFIHHLKNIIDPVKSSTQEIQEFFENTGFENENSLTQSNEVNLVYLLYLYLSRGASDPEETETSLSESVSELSDPELSESLSKSSSSVSLTFSSSQILL